LVVSDVALVCPPESLPSMETLEGVTLRIQALEGQLMRRQIMLGVTSASALTCAMMVGWLMLALLEIAMEPETLVSYVPALPMTAERVLLRQPRGTGELACKLGTWHLELKTSLKEGPCTLCKRDGLSFCRDGTLEVEAERDSCTRFKIGKVASCSAEDYKCNRFNCRQRGVLRVETTSGVFVDAGTEDGMLTCATRTFDIKVARFCSKSTRDCTVIDFAEM